MTDTLADTTSIFCYHCAALTRHTRRELYGDRVAYTCCTCRYGETLPAFERFKDTQTKDRTPRRRGENL